jgi:hypothetical protein
VKREAATRIAAKASPNSTSVSNAPISLCILVVNFGHVGVLDRVSPWSDQDHRELRVVVPSLS